MEPITNPDTSGEVFWMLLTLTSLPPEEAMAHFALETPKREDPRCGQHFSNPLGQLSRALIEYYLGWEENFEDECKAASGLKELCWEMGRTASADPPGPYCLEEFSTGESWKKARRLAQAALNETGMPPVPVPNKIDFSDYIEVVVPAQATTTP